MSSLPLYEDTERFLFSDELRSISWRCLSSDPLLSICRPRARDPLGKWLLMLSAAENGTMLREMEVVAMADSVLQEALDVWEAASMDDAAWKLCNDRDLRLRGFHLYRKEGKLETAGYAWGWFGCSENFSTDKHSD